MKAIKITEANATAIEAALSEANGRSEAHAYTTYGEIECLVSEAERELCGLLYKSMTKRTGNRPGQGRQPTIAPRGQVDRIEARVSSAQKAEYIKRGGSQALRDWLNGKLAEADNSNTVAHNASSNKQGD